MVGTVWTADFKGLRKPRRYVGCETEWINCDQLPTFAKLTLKALQALEILNDIAREICSDHTTSPSAAFIVTLPCPGMTPSWSAAPVKSKLPLCTKFPKCVTCPVPVKFAPVVNPARMLFQTATPAASGSCSLGPQ